MRLGTPITLLAALIAAVLLLSACSSGDEGESEGDGGEAGITTAEPESGGEGSTALSNVEAANGRASEWNDDAQLYAVASLTPTLDAEGESPSWLFTYVSESAGTVASVSVEGEDVAIDPEQELPEADIEFLSENPLPPADELLDSDEAVKRSGEVLAVLEENPEAETAAGLDSVSGSGPTWIFSTIRGEERVEERVPAVGGE